MTQQTLQSNVATTSHWNGEKYHQYSEQQKIVADMLLAQYLFQETDKVLDVGCGDGKITQSIALKVPKGQVMGIDPSESMINFANKWFADNNLSFQINLASTLSFEHEFDVVTSFSSLHWEPKQKEALLCFKKALVPGGAIVLAIPGPDAYLRAALKQVCASLTWNSYFSDYQSPGRVWKANEYAALLIETGFEIRKIESVCRTYVPDDESCYKGLLYAMLPHLSRLPDHLHELFVEEVIDRRKQLGNLDSSGRLKFEVNVLEIIAYNQLG